MIRTIIKHNSRIRVVRPHMSLLPLGITSYDLIPILTRLQQILFQFFLFFLLVKVHVQSTSLISSVMYFCDI